MESLRTTVALGLVASGSAFAFSGPSVQRSSLAVQHSHFLSSQRPPALRQSSAANLKMVDDVVVQGALAAAAGLGTAVAGIYFIEKKAAEGGDKLSETQYTKIAGSMDGSDAENKFSGSDQTLDDLIAAMEAAQGTAKPTTEKVEKKAVAKVSADDDDGW